MGYRFIAFIFYKIEEEVNEHKGHLMVSDHQKCCQPVGKGKIIEKIKGAVFLEKLCAVCTKFCAYRYYRR